MKNKFQIAMTLAVILAMIAATLVLADQVVNNLDTSVDADYETMALNVGGSSGATVLRIIEQNSDGKQGCNLTGSSKQLTVSIASSDEDVATVSPASITFSDCNDATDTTVTVTPVGEGTANITLGLVSFTTSSSGVTDGSFDLLPGRFTVNVAPPPNTAPEVSVTGVIHGASYEFGTVPVAGCSVHDVEDGDSTPPASLSTISGALSAYGLGTQTATCSYTDAGGIEVTVDATYEIVDTTAPTIAFVSRTAANSNGWNNGDVTVEWSCSDNVAVVAPSVSETISAEGINQEVTGTCTDLVGLTASDTRDGINIDLQAPTITASASPLPNDNGWNNSDVTVSYLCADNGPSGVDAAASDLGDDLLSSSGIATGTCVDMAGNSDTAEYTAQIDKGAPQFSCDVPADVWYGDDVVVNCAASDDGSGLTSIFDASFSLSTNVADNTETASAQTSSKTLTDNAGNSVVVGPYIFKVDKKSPEVSCGSADNDWHNANQSISCTATDGGSGPASQNATLSTSVAVDTETDNAYTDSHEFTDVVGNSTTAGAVGPFKIDRKAPSVSATPDRAADFGDWYNHALTITFAGTDGGSGLASCDPAVNYGGPDDASASVSGFCADNVGNSASASFDFQYDGTAPTAALSITGGTPGTNGWYTSDVTVHTFGMGSVSGVTCTDDQYQTDETTGQVFYGSCTSGAGLITNADSLTVKLDKSGPTDVMLTPAGTLGDNGWYVSDVTISTSGTDDISAPVTCTADQFQISDTLGETFEGSCANDAGLTTYAAPLIVKRDTIAPIITASVSPARPASGWWNITSGAPTVTYTCSDGTSGVASCTDPYMFPEGADQIHNGTAVDNAGNSASIGVIDIDVDLTAPSLAWVGGPANGGTYDFGSVPAAPTCTAADTLSGPNGCNVTGYDATVGSHIMTATALDVAGNEYEETRSYTVLAWTLYGFYQPVDMNNVYNVVKNGSTVPLKFEIFTQVSDMEITDTGFVDILTYAQVSCTLTSSEDLIETVATGGTVLRYDTTSGQFIFNWKTPSGTTGKCFRVTMKADDGSSLVAYFKMK